MINFSRPLISRCPISAAMALSSDFALGPTPPADSSRQAAAAPSIWPSVASAAPKDPRIEARAADLLHHLTLEQKVAQMVQADIRFVTPEGVGKDRVVA